MERRAVIALGIFVACCCCASALNPALDIAQYTRTWWTVRDGFFEGEIGSIDLTLPGSIAYGKSQARRRLKLFRGKVG